MWPEFKAWQRGKQTAQQQAEPKHATAKAGQHCVNCGLTLGQQTSWCNCEANRAVEAQQAEPVGDECEDSGSLLGDGFVLEFERWNDVTGALPRGGSWMAEVSNIIQRAAQSGQRAGVAEGWPAAWRTEGWNGCMCTAAEALRFLASNARPIGGEQTFNAEHLLQIAEELQKTQRELLAAAPTPAAQGGDSHE